MSDLVERLRDTNQHTFALWFEAADAIERLTERLEQSYKSYEHIFDAMGVVERQRNHWKANHDNQVEKARILMERPDLPIERVAAYKKWQACEAENAALKAELEEVNADRLQQLDIKTTFMRELSHCEEDKDRLAAELEEASDQYKNLQAQFLTNIEEYDRLTAENAELVAAAKSVVETFDALPNNSGTRMTPLHINKLRVALAKVKESA